MADSTETAPKEQGGEQAELLVAPADDAATLHPTMPTETHAQAAPAASAGPDIASSPEPQAEETSDTPADKLELPMEGSQSAQLNTSSNDVPETTVAAEAAATEVTPAAAAEAASEAAPAEESEPAELPASKAEADTTAAEESDPAELPIVAMDKVEADTSTVTKAALDSATSAAAMAEEVVALSETLVATQATHDEKTTEAEKRMQTEQTPVSELAGETQAAAATQATHAGETRQGEETPASEPAGGTKAAGAAQAMQAEESTRQAEEPPASETAGKTEAAGALTTSGQDTAQASDSTGELPDDAPQSPIVPNPDAETSPELHNDSSTPGKPGKPQPGVPLTQADVRAKALHTIKSMRRERPKAEMPALRGFAGQVFTTPSGRTITAAEYCGKMDRLSRRKGEEAVQLNEDGTVRVLPLWKDPNRKVLSVEARDAMRDRLCTTTPRPGRPAAKKPMWLKQTLVDNKWTDGLVPWPEIPKAEKTEAMRHMYDRYKEERQKKHEQLSGEYLQPLVRLRNCPETPQADLDAYMYRLMKFHLPPKFHAAARECAPL